MNLSNYIDRASRLASDPRSLAPRLDDYEGVLTDSLRRHGEVVLLRDRATYIFIGDIHGNVEDLREILRRYQKDRLESGELRMVFLGDYVDRGPSQLEVLLALLELKLDHPDTVFVLKGNHEGVDVVEPSPHDFPDELISRYMISEGLRIYEAIVEKVFRKLPLAAHLRKCFLALHGGLPTSTLRKAQDLRDYLLGSAQQPQREVMMEVLWNDPVESNEEAHPSPRGAGMLFGRPVTDWVTRTFDVKLVIRGHEPCARGYKFNHGGRVITLFSRVGPPYFNPAGAFLEIDTAAADWLDSVRSGRALRFVKSSEL